MTQSTDKVPKLDDQICFAFYSASRAITARYRELLAPLEVTYPQYLVLMVLWETDSITVSELGDRLQLDSGTLSPLLRRMDKAGLVRRSRRSEDERSVQVSLTTHGDSLRLLSVGVPQLVCDATGLPLGELQRLTGQVTAIAVRARLPLAPGSVSTRIQ